MSEITEEERLQRLHKRAGMIEETDLPMPLDRVISETNKISLKALLDVVTEIKLFCEDVEEKLILIAGAASVEVKKDGGVQEGDVGGGAADGTP
jgi:hypothetical protein